MKQRILLRSMKHCNKGLAALEFALLLPLLVTVTIATVEIVRLAVLHQKIYTASHTLADFVTSSTSVSLASLDAYADTIDQIIKPFPFNGTIIFSSVASSGPSGGGGGGGGGVRGASLDGSSASDAIVVAPGRRCRLGCLNWQVTRRGTDTSTIGTVIGGRATLPNYQLQGTQDVIVVEVVEEFTPILPFTHNIINALVDQKIRKTAIRKPRQNRLVADPT